LFAWLARSLPIRGLLDRHTDFVLHPLLRSSTDGPSSEGEAFSGPEIDQPAGLKVAEQERMRLRFSGPPESTPNNEDPYAEFPSEPEDRADAPKSQDWLAEFPDEKPAAPIVQSKNWLNGTNQADRNQPGRKERS